MNNQEVRIYQLSKCITFRKTTERFGGLSNMASGYPIVVNNVMIRTTEALYQAMRFPNFPDIQREIILQNSPMTAKMVSKKYSSNTREDWDKVRVSIMKWTLRVKLIHNLNTFGNLLLNTEEDIIVEESRKDDFWGAKIIEKKSLEGMNVLGRLLMELRDLHRKYEINEITPLKLNNFKLNGDFIESVFLKHKDNFQIQDGLFK